MKRNDVPKSMNAIATAPFVRNAVPGRTLKFDSSGTGGKNELERICVDHGQGDPLKIYAQKSN